MHGLAAVGAGGAMLAGGAVNSAYGLADVLFLLAKSESGTTLTPTKALLLLSRAALQFRRLLQERFRLRFQLIRFFRLGLSRGFSLLLRFRFFL
jgi:hypothetical protein